MKISLIVFVVLATLLFGGIWVLNRWLKSPELHAQVEKELSLALKMPLKFKTLNLSAFGGLTATGITVPDRGRNFFEAGTFVAKHEFFALLRGKLIFREILVSDPKFVLVQRQTGEWKLPDLPPELQAELDAKKAKKKDTKSEQPKTPKPASEPTKSSDVRIARVRITNGIAELFEKDGTSFITARGIGATLTIGSEDSVEGFTAISRLVWHQNYAAESVKATVKYTPKGIIIQDFKSNLGGGSLTGGFSTKADQPDTPYTAKLNLNSVSIGRAAMDADAPPPNLDGAVSGTLEVRGLWNNRKALNGKGTLSLVDGTCREIEWVNQLGEAMQFEDVDLAKFRIKDLQADFLFAGERIAFKKLEISAPPVGIRAEGTSKLDGTKLDLKAEFLAEQAFLTKRQNVAPQFGPADPAGMRAVAFNLTGSLAKPKQNLLERITGTKDKREQAIRIGLDAINSLKEESEKKENEK